jgi:hypothetical protein
LLTSASTARDAQADVLQAIVALAYSACKANNPPNALPADIDVSGGINPHWGR